MSVRAPTGFHRYGVIYKDKITKIKWLISSCECSDSEIPLLDLATAQFQIRIDLK